MRDLLRLTREAYWSEHCPGGREAGRSFPQSPYSGSSPGLIKLRRARLPPSEPSPRKSLNSFRVKSISGFPLNHTTGRTLRRLRLRFESCCCVNCIASTRVGQSISFASPDCPRPTSASAAVYPFASGRNHNVVSLHYEHHPPCLKIRTRRIFWGTFNSNSTYPPHKSIFIASNVYSGLILDLSPIKHVI